MTTQPQSWSFPLQADNGPAPMLIDGSWLSSISGQTFPTYDPGTGEKIADVALGSEKDAEVAVAAARRAFDEERWMKLPAQQRGAILWRASELIKASADELAELESQDMGIPVPQARAMVLEAAAQFQYYAGWADKIHGRTADLGPAERRIQGYTLREPVGVVAMIVPWNAPLISASKKLAPALAAGCTCVLKPAAETPLTALWLGQILFAAGVPAGVVNIVTGPGSTVGAALAEHDDVDAVAFTGSTEVGRSIIHAGAGNIKKLSLELGGKSPVIVMPDAISRPQFPEWQARSSGTPVRSAPRVPTVRSRSGLRPGCRGCRRRRPSTAHRLRSGPGRRSRSVDLPQTTRTRHRVRRRRPRGRRPRRVRRQPNR